MKVEDIKGPEDIKTMDITQLNYLAADIRKFLIENVSKTGGHLSSNLGVVELTIALHYVFNSPTDKIFFDVGHQSYIHKILTGRANRFNTLRQYNGISGFQKRKESEHDVWEAGHSSTSLSAAYGMAVARDLSNENYAVVPVIGDGAMSGGMALEALNEIGSENRNMIIIFNDNNMSISKNVGALSDVFTSLRTSKPYNNLKSDLSDVLSTSKIGESVLNGMRTVKNTVKKNVVESSFFGDFNVDYIGPVDGHDIKDVIKVLSIAKKHKGPIVVHVITQKGKGYPYSENDTDGRWHGVSQFNPETGLCLSKTPVGQASWSSIISEELVTLAKEYKDVVAITPAMITGSKLEKFFALYPERAFDCGIAEEHATTFAASLANSGYRPFISLYSSFLQRAYDQINHDICRMDLPVIIGIDRAGLVGDDGPTHHGLFDISILRSLPNIILSQPSDAFEAQSLLYTAYMQKEHPFAIRYPRGNIEFDLDKKPELIKIGTWTKWSFNNDSKAIVIAYGYDIKRIINKAEVNETPISVINARFFKPLDTDMLDQIINSKLPVIIYESDIEAGGLSSAILEYCNDNYKNMNFIRVGIKDHYVTHGSLPQLRKLEKIDINTLFDKIYKVIKE
ncbi:MAG: 1-deoxy-D-xylulose-5-phosphate synthase [Erysipelotrichaceae bacterium]